MQIEHSILSGIIKSDSYARTVVPYLQDYHFKDERLILYKLIVNHIDKYGSPPTKESMLIDLGDVLNVPEAIYNASIESIINIYQLEKPTNEDWLLDKTEKYIQDCELSNAVYKAISIMDGSDKKLDRGAIPEILQEALSVSFNSSVGHDFFEDAASRYDYYHNPVNTIPFAIKWLNDVTDGGVSSKTLNCIMAPPGKGKSLVMCDLSSSYLRAGHNVLYITLELAREKITQRIEHNLFNMPKREVMSLSKNDYLKKVDFLKDKVAGRLVVEEYPTSSVNTNHLRRLLKDLKQKKGFVPKIIVVDYLNILLSYRVKSGSGSYAEIKSVSEELRGLAVATDTVIWTGTQSTRDTDGASDMNMNDISESFGTAATVDILLAWIRTAELDQMNQAIFKLLKNRSGETTTNLRHCVGVDYSLMKVIDLHTNGNISDSGYMETTLKPSDKMNEFRNKMAANTNMGGKNGNSIKF